MWHSAPSGTLCRWLRRSAEMEWSALFDTGALPVPESPFRLELDVFEVVQALWNLLLRPGRFVFYKVPLDAMLLGGLEEWHEINLAGAERSVVGDVGVAGQQAGRRPFAHIFEMHQFPPLAVLIQQFDRVLAGVDDPENVHLVMDGFWIRLGHQ